MDRVKKGHEPKGWRKSVELGGAFELVDRANEYARQKKSAFSQPVG